MGAPVHLVPAGPCRSGCPGPAGGPGSGAGKAAAGPGAQPRGIGRFGRPGHHPGVVREPLRGQYARQLAADRSVRAAGNGGRRRHCCADQRPHSVQPSLWGLAGRPGPDRHRRGAGAGAAGHPGQRPEPRAGGHRVDEPGPEGGVSRTPSDRTPGRALAGDTVMGDWTDTAVGLEGNHATIAMLQTPDGRGRLELFEYIHPEAIESTPTRPNDIGMHRVTFSVDDVDVAPNVAANHGCYTLRGVATYADPDTLTYFRGPSRILVMIAEHLKKVPARADGPMHWGITCITPNASGPYCMDRQFSALGQYFPRRHSEAQSTGQTQDVPCHLPGTSGEPEPVSRREPMGVG